MSLGALLVSREVGDPHVALLVHVNAMRRHHHTLAEVCQHLAGVAVELEDGIDRGVFTIHGTAAGSPRAAALIGPNVSVLRIDVDTRGRAAFAPCRKLAPVAL